MIHIKILKLLIDNGPMSTKKISFLLNEDMTVVSSAVKDLLSKKWILSSSNVISDDISKYIVISIRSNIFDILEQKVINLQ